MSVVDLIGRRCAFCSRPGRHLHHVLGRDENGEYLESRGTVRLCTWHHLGVIHRSWRRLGIEVIDERATQAEVYRAGLRRAADFASLAGTFKEPVALEPASWASVGHFLGEAATVWENHQL